MSAGSPYWQFDWALARLKDWDAVAVGLYRNEVGGYNRVEKKGKAWTSRTDEVVSKEQYDKITAKTAYRFDYFTDTTHGTLILLIIPKQGSSESIGLLRERIVKELNGVRR